MDFSEPTFTTIAHRNLWGQWTFVFEKSKLCSLRYTGPGVPSSVQACAYAEPDIVHSLPPSVARAYRKAVQQLNLYLSGKLREFSLPIRIYGTEFQQKVWNAIAQIPYGETRTYQQIAEAIEEPRASRAVGAALHANPLQIILPCHRVVGKGGSLVGYALGLELKRRLLVIEGAIPQELLLE
ncbi:methylated-DNA--[protein]-cysteine S-methyltransferase [uncultured Fibrobacter sp.]|uniref:methylated-DNA--[protein]-cysteine S-methyltransferase n=1 Tax=uncultured Fibrobacter sp. TaxID=261512 RepID=UPI00260EDF7E|nr:methylated-DNA--[protein]-cysteine S-methyltransferase [uncultured Fibrobacter sp.]